MSFSSGGYFHQALSRDKGIAVSTLTDINADKLAEFFVEKVEGVRAPTICRVSPPYIRHDASAQLLSSFH